MSLTPRYAAQAFDLTTAVTPGIAVKLAPFYVGPKGDQGDPGDMTHEELSAAIDESVMAQRFDFDSFVQSTISI